MSVSPAACDLLLALADDEICLGHWYATWIGLAPFLEEDLAFASIGQDELGHARALYGLIEPGGDLDRLAYGRPAADYRCSWLVEDPTPSWEELFVRHLLYDEAETVRWEALRASTLPGLGSLAATVLVEEAFHTRHARSLLARLGQGGTEARRRLSGAVNRLVPLALTLFEPTDDDDVAVAEGVVDAPAGELAQRWRARVDELFTQAGLTVVWPGQALAGPGGRRGVRSPHFAALYEEMTKVYALDPAAHW